MERQSARSARQTACPHPVDVSRQLDQLYWVDQFINKIGCAGLLPGQPLEDGMLRRAVLEPVALAH
jgi:hypothetical protein